MSVRLTEKSVVVKPPHAVRAADPEGNPRATASEIPPKPNGRWRWFVVAAAVVGIGAGVVLARAFPRRGERVRRRLRRRQRPVESQGFVGICRRQRRGSRERRRGVPLRHRARRGRPAERHAPVDRQSDGRRAGRPWPATRAASRPRCSSTAAASCGRATCWCRSIRPTRRTSWPRARR